MTAAVFVVLLVFGVPIAFVLLGTALAYIGLSGNDVLFASFAQQLFSGIEQYGLVAIPLFMLAGELMDSRRSTRRLIDLVSIFVAGLRGGLAYINILANMMMASIDGCDGANRDHDAGDGAGDGTGRLPPGLRGRRRRQPADCWLRLFRRRCCS